MIIVGYPKIEENPSYTFCENHICLDSNLFYAENDLDWAKRYVKIALDLAIQHYNVYVDNRPELDEAMEELYK